MKSSPPVNFGENKFFPNLMPSTSYQFEVEARNEQNINSTKILTVMTGNIGEISLFFNHKCMLFVCAIYHVCAIHAYMTYRKLFKSVTKSVLNFICTWKNGYSNFDSYHQKFGKIFNQKLYTVSFSTCYMNIKANFQQHRKNN